MRDKLRDIFIRLARHRSAAPGWTILIVGLCLIPGEDVPAIEIASIDKVAHLLLFALFAILWRLRYQPVAIAWVLSTGLALALATEALQGALGWGRQPDAVDAVANVIGLVLGLAIARMWPRR